MSTPVLRLAGWMALRARVTAWGCSCLLSLPHRRRRWLSTGLLQPVSRVAVVPQRRCDGGSRSTKNPSDRNEQGPCDAGPSLSRTGLWHSARSQGGALRGGCTAQQLKPTAAAERPTATPAGSAWVRPSLRVRHDSTQDGAPASRPGQGLDLSSTHRTLGDLGSLACAPGPACPLNRT